MGLQDAACGPFSNPNGTLEWSAVDHAYALLVLERASWRYRHHHQMRREQGRRHHSEASAIISAARGQTAIDVDDPRDANNDGKITHSGCQGCASRL